MAKITFLNKVKIKDIAVPEINKFTEANVNEIKTVVNELDDTKLDKNSTIVGATKTKITYDAKGLVTSGADAGVADITGLQGALDLKANLLSPTFTTPNLGVAQGTSLNLSSLTPSQILGTDAFKNLVSLPVATYPSLAELAYSKGVTSPIQTQLNAKAPISDSANYIQNQNTAAQANANMWISGSVKANTFSVIGQNSSLLRLAPIINDDSLRAGFYAAGVTDMEFYMYGANGTTQNVKILGSTGAATFASTVTATGAILTGALSGTSASFSSSVQVGDNTAVASVLNVGARRYREDANNSYIDISMRTGAATFAWINIVTNTWV